MFLDVRSGWCLKDSGDWPVKQIELEGDDCTPLNLLKLRKEVLGPPPDEKKKKKKK